MSFEEDLEAGLRWLIEREEQQVQVDSQTIHETDGGRVGAHQSPELLPKVTVTFCCWEGLFEVHLNAPGRKKSNV